MAKHTKIIMISFITLLACNSLLFGKTEALFSPRRQISETIIKSINSSENSIDIAVFILTSGDFAEALLTAKERGVKIRIVIDEKQGKKKHPILEFLRNEGFGIHYLKGKVGGFMHNTFAVFDSKLLITGSYNWTEYAEKFNYENVILTDEPDVITQFQKEFENLFGKSIKEVETEKETKSAESGTKQQKFKPAVELPENLLEISFEEFDDLFGTESKMGDAEKKKLWNEKFKGNFVKWRGTVRYKGVSLYDRYKIGISQKNSEEADVQLKFDWTKDTKVKMLKIGQTITYIGKLTSLRWFTSPYKLIECDVVE